MAWRAVVRISKYKLCYFCLAHPRSIVPVDPAVPIVAPPPLAVRPPERDHELEDVAGERRRGDGNLRGPRPAARVGTSGRSPGEEAHEEVALLAIDDARVGHARADLPEPRRRATLFAQESQHAEVRAGRPEEALHGLGQPWWAAPRRV